MKKLLLMIIVVSALGLLAGCPSEALPGGESSAPPPPYRVIMPVIHRNPNHLFNTGDIMIHFTSITPDPIFFYTIDGSNPTQASRRFEGPFPLRMAYTDENDRVELRVIGTKAGYAASAVNSAVFHIAEKRWHGDFSGSDTGENRYGYNGGITRVRLTLTDGYISAVTIVTGADGTSMESQDDAWWPAAYNRAYNFMMTMGCVDFDTVAGATLSGISIREAARQALARILAQ